MNLLGTWSQWENRLGSFPCLCTSVPYPAPCLHCIVSPALHFLPALLFTGRSLLTAQHVSRLLSLGPDFTLGPFQLRTMELFTSDILIRISRNKAQNFINYKSQCEFISLFIRSFHVERLVLK